MNKNKILALVFSFAVFAFVLAIPVTSFAVEGPTIDNPIPNITSVNEFVKTLLEGIIKIGIPVVAIAIMYSGFLFVSAQGKPEDIKKAKDALMYTLIGAAILLGAWALAQLISNTVLLLG